MDLEHEGKEKGIGIWSIPGYVKDSNGYNLDAAG